MSDVLSSREIILDADAQHLQTTAARYSWQRSWFNSGRSITPPSPVVSEDDLGRLAAVQFEVVSHGPFVHFGELHVPRHLVAGRDDDVRVIGIFTHRISRHSGDEVSGIDDVHGRLNG